MVQQTLFYKVQQTKNPLRDILPKAGLFYSGGPQREARAGRAARTARSRSPERAALTTPLWATMDSEARVERRGVDSDYTAI